MLYIKTIAEIANDVPNRLLSNHSPLTLPRHHSLSDPANTWIRVSTCGTRSTLLTSLSRALSETRLPIFVPLSAYLSSSNYKGMAQLLVRPLYRSLLTSPAYRPFIPRAFHNTAFVMAPVPRTMKAVQIDENGTTDVLKYRDISVPTPGKGQILVRNQYAGLNFIDTYFRSGLYKAPHFPFTLGREAAGTVVDAASGFSAGQRVVFMGTVGAYAEYSVVDASAAIPIPEDLPTEKAVAAYLQGLTAWTFVREAGEVKAGQWVLVHAAAGGVGLLLVQMLRAVGAKVIGTASSDEKLELAKKNGAEWTINSKDDVVAKVKEITGGYGVDVIFDGIGKDTFDADLEMIALKGHLISFGNAVSSRSHDPIVSNTNG